MRLNRFRPDPSSLPSSTSRNWGEWLIVLVVCCACLSTHSAAQQRASIPQTPRAVQNGTAQLIGPYSADQMLRLVFALKPPHLEEEEQFLNQLQDRDSPLFHKYLSEKEWDERFAPSPQDEQAVAAWAQSQGLTITQRYPNRLLVDVEAPVALIEKALDVTINRYQMGSASYYSNDRDPAIPAQFVGVAHAVLGLNNIEVAHAASKGSQNFTGPDYSPGPAYAVGSHLMRDANGKKPNGATTAKEKNPDWFSGEVYWPGDLWGAGGYNYGGQWNGDYRGGLYNLGHCCNPLNNPNNSPPEASIAVAIWGDYADSDFQFFIQVVHIAANVQRYFVDGTPACCSPETTLDVEWATAAANSFSSAANTAEIHMYEGANDDWATMLDTVNRALSDGHARVLSMSWGGAEVYNADHSTMDSYHAVFNQMVGQGWTLVAASGDWGATADCSDHLSVLYPASDPDITAAGGTTLEGGEYGYLSETGWRGGPYGCSNNDGGSGGGCSAYYAAPNYQSSPACGANSRSLPDLALNADGVNTPQIFSFNGGLYPTGGTSIAAPEIAGFYAQANAYLLYIGSVVGNTCGSSYSAPCAPLGNANPYLYAEGYGQFAPHYPFYDITSGCNGNDITQQYGLPPFCAGPGYDMVTGWGSANMLQLSWMMNAYMAGDGARPEITFSGPQPNHWYNTDQTISWTIADTSANGHAPNGVSGYTFYWDNDPGDPYSQPTSSPQGDFGSTPNSFYYGPFYPNSSNGWVDLAAMRTYGCHALFVRAWDNAGQASVNSVGPMCYDPYPPVTYFTLTGNLQGQYYAGPVLVTLAPNDYNGSGVENTVYEINGGAWQNYTGAFYVAAPGIYSVGFYSRDNAGNVATTQYANFIIAYNSQNSLTVTKTGNGSGTITSADGNINCGSICSYTYYYEQPVTLIATPAVGSVLTGWTGCDLSFGNSCTLNVNADRTAVATFSQLVALQFVPIAPCRVVDTRNPNGPFGGPAIQGQSSRDFAIPSGGCDIPSSAAAYALNVTVVPVNSTLGFMTAWPTGFTRTLTSTLNSPDGRIKANATIVPAGANGAVSIYASDTSHVVLDIDGYFAPLPNPDALAFYPLTPCRVADTRNPNGPLGGPYLHGGQQRDFPVLEATTCNIPANAQAYSMNLTVVPRGGMPLGYLTVWPSGQARPLASTLNDLPGAIIANAAIVPAGTGGDIDAYVTEDTDLVIDIDGYFAAPGAGGLSLYTFSPCRALDTRRGEGAFSGTLVTNFVTGPCALPSAAKGYVLNATVVPLFPLGYLTLWPDSEDQPLVSTLNAVDGSITSNMAIVPNVNGSTDAYTTGFTQLILDISSYFAP